jgi:hypothetical protein
MEELSDESQWKDPVNVEDFPRASGPMRRIMDPDSLSRELWPWFSGQIGDFLVRTHVEGLRGKALCKLPQQDPDPADASQLK